MLYKRVEGTKTVEIIDGKRVEKGVYSLVGILTRLIESWSIVTRDWNKNPRVLARDRTVGLDQEFIDIVIGGLLGDATAEVTKGSTPGFIIKFLQGAVNGEYIKWIHSRLIALKVTKDENLVLQSQTRKEYTSPSGNFFAAGLQQYYTFRTFAISFYPYHPIYSRYLCF